MPIILDDSWADVLRKVRRLVTEEFRDCGRVRELGDEAVQEELKVDESDGSPSVTGVNWISFDSESTGDTDVVFTVTDSGSGHVVISGTIAGTGDGVYLENQGVAVGGPYDTLNIPTTNNADAVLEWKDGTTTGDLVIKPGASTYMVMQTNGTDVQWDFVRAHG